MDELALWYVAEKALTKMSSGAEQYWDWVVVRVVAAPRAWMDGRRERARREKGAGMGERMVCDGRAGICVWRSGKGYIGELVFADAWDGGQIS